MERFGVTMRRSEKIMIKNQSIREGRKGIIPMLGINNLIK